MIFFGFIISSEILWLLGIAGSLAVLLLRHWLEKSKDRSARRASASVKFRSVIYEVTTTISNTNGHWVSDADVILNATLPKIKTAVAEFRPFVVFYRRHRFDRAWNAYRQHCVENIPEQLGMPNIFYGTGPQGAKEAKKTFYRNVETLLSFAKQT